MSAVLTPQQAEVQLQDEIFQTWDDPLAFMLKAWPWGVPGTRLERFPGPDKWQAAQAVRIRDAIRADPTGYQVRESIASGHGIGKGAQQAMLTIWAMCTQPHLSGVTTANTGHQLRSKTWKEVKVWLDDCVCGHWLDWTATRLARKGYGDTWAQFAIPNSESNAEAFAGLHGRHVLIVVDECSLIPQAVMETLEGAMSTPKAIWLNFGNPTRNSGAFFSHFNRFRHRWTTRNIDSRDCRMATLEPANVEKIEADIADHGIESDFVKVRILGQFPSQSSTTFIGRDIVQAARERSHTEHTYGPKVLGVDVARFGDDASVITRVQGRKMFPQKVFRGMDLMKLASWVAAEINETKPDIVRIDAVGLGSGVVDRLRQMGYEVEEVHGGSSPPPALEDTVENLRAAAWWSMREWLKDADIPDDQDLADDLTMIEYSFSRRMLIQLEKKSEMKKRGLASPDKADSLSMCFAFPFADVIEADDGEPEEVPDY